MIYAILVVAIALSTWLRSRRRSLERAGSIRSVPYFLTKQSLVFLTPLACAALPYAALDAYVNVVGHDDLTTLDRLYWLDNQEHRVRAILGGFKPPWWMSLAVLVGVFLIGASSALASARAAGNPATVFSRARRGAVWFGRYAKGVGIAYTVLTLLSSFTFLSSTLDPAFGSLRLRIKGIEEDVVRLGAGIARALEDDIEDAALRQVLQQAPSPVTNLRRDIETLTNTTVEMVDRDRPVIRTLVGRHARYAQIIERSRRRLEVASAAIGVPVDHERFVVRDPATPGANPADVSVAAVRNAQQVVSAHRRDLTERIETLLRLDERTKLTAKGISTLVDRSRKSLVDTFVAEFPFAEPILDVLAKTLADVTSAAVERHLFEPILQRLSAAAMRGDSTSFAQASVAARDVVATNGRVREHWAAAQPSGSLEKLAQHERRVASELRDVQAVRAEVDETLRTWQARKAELLRDLAKALVQLGRDSAWTEYVRDVVLGFRRKPVSEQQLEDLMRLTALATTGPSSERRDRVVDVVGTEIVTGPDRRGPGPEGTSRPDPTRTERPIERPTPRPAPRGRP